MCSPSQKGWWSWSINDRYKVGTDLSATWISGQLKLDVPNKTLECWNLNPATYTEWKPRRKANCWGSYYTFLHPGAATLVIQKMVCHLLFGSRLNIEGVMLSVLLCQKIYQCVLFLKHFLIWFTEKQFTSLLSWVRNTQGLLSPDIGQYWELNAGPLRPQACKTAVLPLCYFLGLMYF